MSNPSNQNPGCFPSILRLFGLPPKRVRSSRNAKSVQPGKSLPLNEDALSTDELEDALEDLPYRVRDDFLSPTELSFYHVLRTVLGSQAIICPKVGLAEIFFITRPNENYAYRSRIVQKHLDFLLCDPKTMQPLLGIELDDSSHARPDRQARDRFVNKAFEAANLPLLRFPVRRTYNTRELAGELAKYLGEAILSAEVAPVEQALPKQETPNSAPFCPNCGERMVVRTVAKGDHQGKQFYGCPNYPRCRKMLPLK